MRVIGSSSAWDEFNDWISDDFETAKTIVGLVAYVRSSSSPAGGHGRKRGGGRIVSGTFACLMNQSAVMMGDLHWPSWLARFHHRYV